MGIPVAVAISISVEVLQLAQRAISFGCEVSEEELNEAVARRQAARTTWELSRADAAARREEADADEADMEGEIPEDRPYANEVGTDGE